MCGQERFSTVYSPLYGMVCACRLLGNAPFPAAIWVALAEATMHAEWRFLHTEEMNIWGCLLTEV